MAAEIYRYHPEGEEADQIRAQLLYDGQTNWEPGYGDGNGSETCVMIDGEGTVQVMTGRVVRANDDPLITHRLDTVKAVCIVEVGEQHTERLQNPEGEEVVLCVKNIGQQATAPYVAELPTNPPLIVSTN